MHLCVVVLFVNGQLVIFDELARQTLHGRCLLVRCQLYCQCWKNKVKVIHAC